MNLKVEYGIIAILLLASLYYFFKHQSLLSDLSRVQEEGNPELKVVKGKHNTPISHVYPGIGKKYQDLYKTEPKCRGLSNGSKRDPNQVWACELDGKDPDKFCRDRQSPQSYCSKEDGSRGLGACCSMRPEKENGHGGWE